VNYENREGRGGAPQDPNGDRRNGAFLEGSEYTATTAEEFSLDTSKVSERANCGTISDHISCLK
jgi:hypothetical protein